MVDLREEGVDTKKLNDYATLTIMDTIFGIKRPTIASNNFEIKLIII